MSAKQLRTSDEAKTYACEVTNGELSFEKAQRQLIYFRRNLENMITDEQTAVWSNQIRRIEDWLSSERFQRGEYARGLDDLLLELIEWRALIFAFQNVETEGSPFKEHVFFSQWLFGGTYTVFALLGQLVSRHRRDTSLWHLWNDVSPFIESDGACTREEFDCIKQRVNEKTGHFTNENSKAFMFRNKVIAHNEWSPTIPWLEIDKDIEILVRIWSLVVSWASFGRFEPFRTDDQAFAGLESFFNDDEMKRLKAKRQAYLSGVFRWAVNFLHNGQRDPGRGGFSKLSVTSSMII
jgi:hypothetical protein